MNNSKIQTVTGVISSDNLGYCQCHEHVFLVKGKSYEISPVLWMDDLALSTMELLEYKKAGGLSIVDAQPVGCGRMAGCLYEASVAAGVNIIASTGFHKLVFYGDNHWIHSYKEDSLSQIFINELLQGMYTDADHGLPGGQIPSKSGIIKTAVDSFGIRGEYVKLFRAAAAAALESGYPLMCHIEKGADAFEVIKFFEDSGIGPESLIICHLDRANYDFAYHKEVAGTGVYLEYDTIARFKYHDNDAEIKLIQMMLEAGFGDRILLGLDTTRERLKNYGGSIGLDYLKESFIPLMLDAGITAGEVDNMMVINPGMALAIRK